MQKDLGILKLMKEYIQGSDTTYASLYLGSNVISAVFGLKVFEAINALLYIIALEMVIDLKLEPKFFSFVKLMS